jgi:hypothetical protein
MPPIFACLMLCGTQIGVSIDARATPEARSETRFVLAASDPRVRATNPDYLAIAKAVARALSTQGFEEAKSPDDGDVVVLVDWMVSEPKVVAHHAGGDVGGPQVSGAAAGTKGMPAGGAGNNASFGFGAEATDRADLVYSRTVILRGVDRAAYRADPTAKGLWDMTLKSDGDTDDVPTFAPQMIAVALPYMASNAGKVRGRLGSTEDPVKFVRGDIPALPAKKP